MRIQSLMLVKRNEALQIKKTACCNRRNDDKKNFGCTYKDETNDEFFFCITYKHILCKTNTGTYATSFVRTKGRTKTTIATTTVLVAT